MNSSLRYTKVVAIDSEYVFLQEVEVAKQSGCKGCDVKSNCGTHLLSEWLNKSDETLKLPKTLFKTARLGEHYSISVPESFIVKMSLINYALPLISAVVATYFGSLFGDAISVLTFVLGILAGIKLSRLLCNSYERSFLKFLHIIPTNQAECSVTSD